MMPLMVMTMFSLISFNGIKNAPFYLLFIYYIMMRLYGVPHTSSFRNIPNALKKGNQNLDKCKKKFFFFLFIFLKKKKKDFVSGKIESITQLVGFIVLPLLFYYSIYSEVFFQTFHLMTFLALICIEMFMLRTLLDKNVLWWFKINEDKLKSIKHWLTAVSIFLGVLCFEYRVIFYSYYNLIR